jgi:hypothetical protein
LEAYIAFITAKHASGRSCFTNFPDACIICTILLRGALFLQHVVWCETVLANALAA